MTTTTNLRVQTIRHTVRRACHHCEQVTLRGLPRTRHLQLAEARETLCARCEREMRAAKEAADAVYAEYTREQERLAARRYCVTLHYDAHPLLDARIVWEGTGFWIAARWAQDAAKSLLGVPAQGYVEHTADNLTYRAFRPDWATHGRCYILEGHASVTEVTETQPTETQPTRLTCHKCGNTSGGTAWWWDTRLWDVSADGAVCPVCLRDEMAKHAAKE